MSKKKYFPYGKTDEYIGMDMDTLHMNKGQKNGLSHFIAIAVAAGNLS